MSFDFDSRLARARSIMSERELGAFIIGPGSEMRYFTGRDIDAHERLACLVITATDIQVVAPGTDVPGGWADGEDPYGTVVDTLPAGAIAFGSSLTAPHVLRFQELIDAPTHLLPEGLFEIKEPVEIAELARAGAAIDAVHARVPALLVAGRTEAEVAAELSTRILDEHKDVDFVIVGSGENGANPHHSFSSRVLRAGDPVVVDIGGTLDTGYHSDSTRTYVVPGAQPPVDFVRAYEAVLAAFEAAFVACRPGITAGELDAVARATMTQAGYGEYFFHRLGHGIGLAGHERPWIVGGNNTVLAEDMTFSIEPGVYVEGKWGVRIEDIVVVKEGGTLTLNKRPRRLIL